MNIRSMHVLRLFPLLIGLSILLGSCETPSQSVTKGNKVPSYTFPLPETVAFAIPDSGVAHSLGQLVYVPNYSSVPYYDNSKKYNLSGLMSIHNTSLDQAITVNFVHYFNNDGEMIDNYLEGPLTLKPMASTSFVINERDLRGGIGANFLIEWQSAVAVTPPLVEGVMVGTAGTQGIAFTSSSRVLRNKAP